MRTLLRYAVDALNIGHLIDGDSVIIAWGVDHDREYPVKVTTIFRPLRPRSSF